MNRDYPLPDFLRPYTNGVADNFGAGVGATRWINLGVLGKSGAGKSSLIRAMLEHFLSARGAETISRPVSSFEGDGTRAPQQYKLDNFGVGVHVGDLPGHGTTMFPSETYLRDMGLRYFDIILVITDARWTETDCNLLPAIAAVNIWYLVVRTKVDRAVDDGANDHGHTQDESLIQVRTTLLEQVSCCDSAKLHLVTTRRKHFAASEASFGTVDALCEQLANKIRELM